MRDGTPDAQPAIDHADASQLFDGLDIDQVPVGREAKLHEQQELGSP